MNILRVGIIGTAGRKDDFTKLTSDHFERMISTTIKIIGENNLRDGIVQLYSGGAAWADHIAVSLCVRGFCNPKNLTLFLPCHFDNYGFVDDIKSGMRTAKTIDFYHFKFSEKIRRNSIMDLMDVRYGGASLVPGNGNFFDRNTKIAESLREEDLLIAFTFGDPSDPTFGVPWEVYQCNKDTTAKIAGLKPGGTADTWNKSKCKKIHVLLD